MRILTWRLPWGSAVLAAPKCNARSAVTATSNHKQCVHDLLGLSSANRSVCLHLQTGRSLQSYHDCISLSISSRLAATAVSKVDFM